MRNHHIPTVVFYACVVSLGGFLFGFDASVISGVVGFIVPEFGLNDWQIGMVVSAPTLAAILTGIIVGPASDLVGRKKVLMVVAVLYLASAVASALAPNFWVLVAARALGGFAFGSLLLAPLYIAEISPPKLRGRIVSINQMNIVVGISVAYFANYFLLQLSGSGAQIVESLHIERDIWRWMLGLEAIPAVAYCVLLLFIPESPRWLVIRGRHDDARCVISKLIPTQDVQPALEEIQQSADEFRRRRKSRLAELFSPELRMVLLIGIIVGVAQQITGINAVFFYATSIFEQSGVGKNAAFAQATFVGVINVVFTIVAMLLVDRLGRKPLLIFGLAGVFLSMSLAAYGFSQATYQLTPDSVQQLYSVENPPDIDRAGLESMAGTVYTDDVAFKRALRQSLGDDAARAHEGALIKAAIDMNPYIVLVGILGFVASFAVSLGPVMWVLLSELYPNAIRGLAMAAVGFFNSGISWGVQFFFPWELNNLGTAWTFLIYGLFALLAMILVAALLRETRGKTLEQIERENLVAADTPPQT
jgi:sugar porter (SP) family MFS transporter